MARRPRLIVPAHAYHLMVLGNNRQPVFLSDADRKDYRDVLQAACGAEGLLVHAYVLMIDAVHVIATPQRVDAMARTMQAVGRAYVRRFNRRHGRSGTLWEGRYRASIIQAEPYLLVSQRYLETMPVRAGWVARPQDYRWSSHRHHLGLESDSIVSSHSLYWALGNTPFEREIAYAGLFEADLSGSGGGAQADVARCLTEGRPVADVAFLERLERTLGGRWVPRPVGRPRRNTRAAG